MYVSIPVKNLSLNIKYIYCITGSMKNHLIYKKITKGDNLSTYKMNHKGKKYLKNN